MRGIWFVEFLNILLSHGGWGHGPQDTSAALQETNRKQNVTQLCESAERGKSTDHHALNAIGRAVEAYEGIPGHAEEVVDDIHEPGELGKKHNAVTLGLQTAEQARQRFHFPACAGIAIAVESCAGGWVERVT